MGKVLTYKRRSWRDWQSAKRHYESQPPLPPEARGRTGGGLLASPFLPLAALALLGGLFWAMSEKYSLRLPTTEVVRGSALFTVCSGAAAANCVIDGDTLRVGGEKIRLADIDAPEIFSPACPLEKMIGLRAQRRLLELVNGRPFAMEAPLVGRVDRYGRKLRTLTRDGRSLGDTLVFEGLASASERDWCKG